MSDQYIGQIQLLPYFFAPSGWALCQGQLLSITQNTALFSLLGTLYGGDGRSTFALPNLQGILVLGQGAAPGLSSYPQGSTGGTASVTLNGTQFPAHTHTLPATSARGTLASPGQAGLAATLRGTSPYAPGGGATMAPGVQPAGNSASHNNLMPYLVLNYCIALTGVFPPRP